MKKYILLLSMILFLQAACVLSQAVPQGSPTSTPPGLPTSAPTSASSPTRPGLPTFPVNPTIASSPTSTGSPCSDRGWAEITSLLVEFDYQTGPGMFQGVIVSELLKTLTGIKDNVAGVPVDACTETARGLVVSSLENRINAQTMMLTGKFGDPAELMKSFMQANQLMQSAQEELTALGLQVVLSSATPVATPQQSSTQTSDQTGLEIINDFCYGYATEGGSMFQVAGEVRNNSNVPMFALIIATVYNDRHEVVGTEIVSPELEVIPPGGKSPFVTDADQDTWPAAASCEEEAQGFQTDPARMDLKILSQENSLDAAGLHIQGVVQNSGTTPAINVRVVVTLYDLNGKVIAVTSTPSTLATIPAGGTSPFAFYPLRWSRYDHYQLQVQGE